MKTVKLSLLLTCIATMHVNSAIATDVFNLEGYGPISRAMGGTGVANNIGAAGMMYNPATIGLMKLGSQAHIGAGLIIADISAKNRLTGETATIQNHSNNRSPYFAPQLAFTESKANFSYGFGVFASGGLGTEYGSDSFLSKTSANAIETKLENSSRLLNLRAPFAIAYHLNDKLTVGGSVDVAWSALNLELLLDASQVGSLIGSRRASGSLVPVLAGIPGLSGAHFSLSKDKLVGGRTDAVGVGGKIGMTYHLIPGTRFGIVYNFKTSIPNLKGGARLTAVTPEGNAQLTGKIKIRDLQMPAQLSIGIAHQFNDQLTLVIDAQRTFWKDVMKDIDVGFIQDGTGAFLNVQLPQNFRDTNTIKVGAEYQFNKTWTFRGGVSHSSSAIPGNTQLAIVPAILKTHLSAGFSVALSESSRIDFAYTHALKEKLKNSSQPNTSVPIETAHSQNNLALAYTYQF